LTNYSINKNSEKYSNAEDENELDENSSKANTKVTLAQVWRMIRNEYPEADIQALKQKVRDISLNVLRSSRSAIEVKCSEMLNMNMPAEVNNKFFHVLGLDIMFDDNFDAWLFETNRFPSMDIFFTKENKDGTSERNRSLIDEKIKGTLLHESFKILVGKQESEIFTKLYDSGEVDSEEANFVYEKVFKIYKALCGGSLKSFLSIAELYQILNILPESVDSKSINLEPVLQTLTESPN